MASDIKLGVVPAWPSVDGSIHQYIVFPFDGANKKCAKPRCAAFTYRPCTRARHLCTSSYIVVVVLVVRGVDVVVVVVVNVVVELVVVVIVVVVVGRRVAGIVTGAGVI